jgi:hypothetical protein
MTEQTTGGVCCGALALLTLFACGGARPPGATAEERCANWVERGLTVDARTRATLRETIGAPESVDVTTEPNRHIPDGIDTLVTVDYPGVAFSIRKPPEGGDLTERVVVNDNRWLRWTDPGIGTTVERVITSLGEPTDREETLLRFSCGRGIVEEPVTFVLENGRVSEILFDFYVD